VTQPSYSPHQVQSGGVVNSDYPMGSNPPVPSGSIPPHLQGDSVTNGAQYTAAGLDAANSAVSAAMSGHGQGIFDVPKYNNGGPGMSGS
jgi:hypothetical protein